MSPISLSNIRFGSLYSGMPYLSQPPSSSEASYTVAEYPIRFSK